MAENGGLIVGVAFLLIFGGIITLTDDDTTQPITQCNDGIDNDGDGQIDAQSIDGQIPAESNCQYIIFDGASPTSYACFAWDDEATTPSSIEECGY